MNKKRYLIPLLILICVLTAGGCGTGGSSGNSNKYAASDYGNSGTGTAEESTASEGVANENGDSAETADESAAGDTKNQTESNVNTDMLVYTCNLRIDTLDYEHSVNTFKNMLTAVNGFVEQENYTDGHSYGSYYIEETDKDKTYTATVRVPHDKYNDFLDGTNELGDVRSKTSNVQNLGQEYTDLNTSLQIYEAKEKRYIKMLSTITDDDQAIKIEKELTELQIKIASLKTRMTEIKTDVDYSTIDISIHEVSKYNEEPEPEKTDTFFQRLGNTIKNTWHTFLNFMEALLFLFIRVSPYLIILVIILLIIYRVQKNQNKKRAKQPEQKTPVRNSPDMIHFDTLEAEAPDTEQETNEDNNTEEE